MNVSVFFRIVGQQSHCDSPRSEQLNAHAVVARVTLNPAPFASTVSSLDPAMHTPSLSISPMPTFLRQVDGARPSRLIMPAKV
jgi:hypothetical protein